jgi:hypothetical protein
LIAVNDGFFPLLDALDRADRKGYLPDAMAAEWAAFDYRKAVAPTEFEQWVDRVEAAVAKEQPCAAPQAERQEGAGAGAVLARGRFHDNTGTDVEPSWEWFESDITCATCVDAVIVRADVWDRLAAPPAAPVAAMRGVIDTVPLSEVEALARTMWRGEVLPGRVLRFGAAVLGLVDAALAAPPAQQVAPQEEVTTATVVGALFDFLGYLTSRKERVTFSSSDDASPAVDALRAWAGTRNLPLEPADVKGWSAALASMAQQVAQPARMPMTTKRMRDLADGLGVQVGLSPLVSICRAVELHHGITLSAWADSLSEQEGA